MRRSLEENLKQLRELNRKHDEVQKELVESQNELTRYHYDERFKKAKKSIRKTGGIFRPVRYKATCYTNSMNIGALWFISAFFTQEHNRIWDHYPTDDEINDFIYSVYGPPEYKEYKPMGEYKKTSEEMLNRTIYISDDNGELVPLKLEPND